MRITLSAAEIYNRLLESDIIGSTGFISFNLGETSVTINTTDTVGVTLQAWLKQWLLENNIYFSEPENTQEFPDFYLNDLNREQNMLEVKAFNYCKTPAFDIANFESYCASLEYQSYRLDADYLIFGYSMGDNGAIRIERIWLKKIWEIAGTSARYPLKTQVKRDVIYNIRPSSNFKTGTTPPFRNKEELIRAIYGTLSLYRGEDVALRWLENVIRNYRDFTSIELNI